MGGLELCTELWSIQVSLQTFLRYYLYAAVTLRFFTFSAHWTIAMKAPLHPLLEDVQLECRNGWYNIVRVLCEQLQDQADRFGAPEPKVLEVKEKYGTLHFYANQCSQTQYALIELAEELSAHTCEVCGKAATLRRFGWLQTLCDEHAEDAGT